MAELTQEDERVLESLLKERRLPLNTLRRLVREGSPDAVETLIGRLGADVEARIEATILSTPADEDDIGTLHRTGTAVEAPNTPAPPRPGGQGLRGSAVVMGELLPGSDRYKLLDLIGRGGMGEVWNAEDLTLGRRVALKVLLPGANEQSDLVRRFVYEARATGMLSHPGIIPVHDAGMLPDGRWYYTMTRIAGRDLQAILGDVREGVAEAVDEFPLPRLLHLFTQVCHTMAYAHDHGFIHRDLKPENILIGAYGEVYIADWGLAKCFDTDLADGTPGADPDARLKTGAVLGTAGYMSPEQISGDLRRLQPASDVWSLACILFELLTLKLPFDGPNLMAIAIKVVGEHAPDPADVADGREVPWQMSQLTLEGLDREPEARPTARHMAERVEAFLDGVEEQRRRAARAAERLDAARTQADDFRARWAALAEARRDVARAERELPPTATHDDRMEVWRRHEAIESEAREADRIFAQATAAASHSINYRDSDDAHALLAELYWMKAEAAEEAGDASTAIYFRSLVEQHDRGAFADRMSDTGRLEVLVEAEGATVQLERQVSRGPLLVGEPTGFVRNGPVQVGSYVVVASAPGHVTARVPVVVRGNRTSRVVVQLPPEFEGHERWCFVAGGPFTVGGDDEAIAALPRETVELAPFYIARNHVTMAEYCAFLTDLAATDFEQARGHAPRTSDGTIWVDVDEAAKRFTVPEVDRDGDRWDPNWPVLMVNWHDANAYAAWLSARDGVTYRLPGELEWEKAARGVDGRLFPWGNRFDATLARSADTGTGGRKPSAVGAHPWDRSPYGALDMAGNAVEWTSTPDPDDPARYIQRGGGFYSPAPWCRAASRKAHEADRHFVQFGFRLVRELG